MDKKYYVERFSKSKQVTFWEEEFDSLEAAKSYFEGCIAGNLEPADEEDTEWILSTTDEDGEFLQIESYTYD